MTTIINFLNHTLTQDQVRGLDRAFPGGYALANLRDVVPAAVAAEVANTGDDPCAAAEGVVAALFAWDEEAESFVNTKGITHMLVPGGSPAFMSALTRELIAWGLRTTMVFAHSRRERESEDQVQPDGSTRKVAVFRHQKWLFVKL